MVNFGFSSASILGIFLAVAGVGLYVLRTVRPELSRDHDLFFAAVGLLCGLILLFQGWRLDPILQFGQFLITGSAIFFAVETVRLRGATAEQARRSSPLVDDDRRVSKTRVYTEAELDQLEPYEENYPNSRRLGGYAEPRSTRNEDYDSPSPRTAAKKPRRSSSSDRPSSDRPSSDRPSSDRSSERSSSRSSARPAERPVTDRYSEDATSNRPRRPRSNSSPTSSARADSDRWEDSSDMWEEAPPSRRPRRPASDNPETSVPPAATQLPRKRRPRPSEASDYDNPPPTTADYVDYQPIDDAPARSPEDWDDPTRRERPNREDRNDRPEGDAPRFDY